MLRSTPLALPLVVLVLASSLFVGCSDSDGGSAAADATPDYGQPVTERPDDGVDTGSAEDAGADASGGADSGLPSDGATADGSVADSTSADSAVADSAVADSAVADSASSDAPAAAAGPRLHEVYVDRNLEGDKVEYVEIAAPAGTALDDLWLRVIDKTGAPVFNLRVADAGVKMKASGYWVVGSSFVSSDKTYSLTEWGLPNDGGTLQLLRLVGATNVLVDVLGYGTVGSVTGVSEPKKLVEGTAATLPASGSTGRTLGRKAVPGDTDDNAADFCVMTATPGAANGGCL